MKRQGSTLVHLLVSPLQHNLSNSSSSASLNCNSSLEEFSNETPPKKYKSLADIFGSCQFSLTVSNLMSYEEAAEKEEGKKAMVKEMQSIEKAMVEEMQFIEKNGTWDMVDLLNEMFYGDLQEEVYITQLEGFIKKDK